MAEPEIEADPVRQSVQKWWLATIRLREVRAELEHAVAVQKKAATEARTTIATGLERQFIIENNSIAVVNSEEIRFMKIEYLAG